jgi:hypothetical protein
MKIVISERDDIIDLSITSGERTFNIQTTNIDKINELIADVLSDEEGFWSVRMWPDEANPSGCPFCKGNGSVRWDDPVVGDNMSILQRGDCKTCQRELYNVHKFVGQLVSLPGSYDESEEQFIPFEETSTFKKNPT